MQGLGLTNAVQQFQQGKQFTQGLKDAEQRRTDMASDRAYQQEVRGRQRQQWGDEDQRRATAEAARQAFSGVIDTSKAEWAMNGAQGEYKPNDTTMFKAAEAAGAAFAKAGDWDGYMRNEVAVQGQRTRVRSGALQRYEQDGDIEALARTVYPTVFDGKDIAAVEKIPGAEGGRGREASPGMVRIKLSDGTTQDMQPNEIVTMVKQSLIDPAKAAEQEIMLNLARMKAEIEAEGKIKVERVKGEEARQTTEADTKGKLSLADAKQTFESGESEKERAARLRERQIAAGATLGSAKISAGASKYSADRSLEGAKLRAKAEGSGPGGVGKRLTTKERLTMVEDSFGQITEGGFGSKRIGSATTAKIVEGMEAYLRQNPDATESEAMNAAARVMGIKPEPVAR